MKTQSKTIAVQPPTKRNTMLAIYTITMTTFMAAYTMVLMATNL